MNAMSEQVPYGAPVLDGLALLADPTRSRLLAVLDGIELTVAELCDTLALPQSTVSRHLKTLGDAGWVAARRDGASRYYGLTVDRLPESSQRLWELVRADVASSLEAGHDRRRLQPVLDRRRVGSVQFFSTSAGQWDELRAELFGATSDLRILPALLPPDCVVGDLGCGSGRITAAVAPFVGSVVAVDSSTEMLAVARERINGAGNVTISEGSLEALRHGGERGIGARRFARWLRRVRGRHHRGRFDRTRRQSGRERRAQVEGARFWRTRLGDARLWRARFRRARARQRLGPPETCARGGLGRRPAILFGRGRAVRNGAGRCGFVQARRAWHRHVARRIDRHGAHDVLLDHEVARTANHQQMLDIIAPDQHQAAPAIDRGGVDHGKPRLAPALRGGADAGRTETANEPEGQSDEGEYDDERNDEAHDQ